MVNYVKFIRGTEEAFNKLNNKDNDTLYFISKTKDGDNGKLYLGNKLISGFSDIHLNDIENILIDENILPNSILIFDINLNKWVAKTLPIALRDSGITLTEMIGATANTDGATGLVPQPLAGFENNYLRGDGTWNNPTAAIDIKLPQIETAVGNLNNQINQIVVQESLLSLKQTETSSQLINLNNRTVQLETKVTNLESTLNELNNNQLDISQLTTVVKQQINNLSFTKQDFSTKIGNLKQLYSYNPFLNDDEQVTIVEDINDLDERLRWAQLKN